MKKLTALLLTLMMLIPAAACGLAETDTIKIDLSGLDMYLDEDMVEIVPFSDGSARATIYSTISVKDRAFVHKYDSDVNYSFTEADIILLNYGTDDMAAYLRWWITYCADNGYQNITSADFYLNGLKYTFTGIDVPALKTDGNGSYEENLVVLFDINNVAFLGDVMELYNQAWSGAIPEEECRIRMVLHGDEDLEAELGMKSLEDLSTLTVCLSAINGYDVLLEEDPDATSMTVTAE